MHLTSLHLKNFRGFKESSFDFLPGINLIIGINGSGKTALLEACSISMGTFLSGLNSVDSKSLKIDDVRIEAFQSGREISFEQQFPVQIIAHGEVGNREIKWIVEKNKSKGRQSNSGALDLIDVAKYLDFRVRGGDYAILPVLAYYGNGRLWQDSSKNNDPKNGNAELPSRFDGYKLALRSSCSASALQKWIGTREWEKFVSNDIDILLELIYSTIAKTIEGVKNVIFSAKRREIVLEFENGNKLPFSLLSDGQRELVALIGDIAVRMIQLNPQFRNDVLTKTPGIVLIDEVDLYLHPKWQREILNKLSTIFPLVQFICTTHSPQIIGEVAPDRIIVLDPNHGLEHSFGLDSNTIIEDVMNALPRNEKVFKLLQQQILLSLRKSWTMQKKSCSRSRICSERG
ncbi:AAA family ATPase [Ignavibacteriales bacterium]